MRSGKSIVGLVVISFGLAGCMAGTEGGQRAPGSLRPGQVIERDIEAPNVFSRRERALWDGRPSLGGVWVAHPDARTPERVIIRNAENGKETVGALFRRERMNPGPVFQMSADAAVAVEMLAGAPTMIEVIALRTEEITIGGAPQTEGQPDASEPATEPAPQAVAAAAAPVAPPAPTPAPAPDSAAADADTLIALPDEPAARPARTNPLARLFARRERATPDAVPGDQITTQSLDDAPMAAAAPAASPTRTPMPTPTPSPQPVASATAATPAATSSLSTPFVQLGIFSVEANANRARALAEGAGMSARVVQGTANGNAFWRVVVGPAQDQAGLRALTAQARGLGFNDAYAVRR